MVSEIATNGLDMSAIHPSNGAKYSPNLYKWLNMRSRKHHATMSRVYSDKSGRLWIGMIDNGDLFGAKLMNVLCCGSKADSACWVGLGELVEVVDFWQHYTKIGRCAIDPTHTVFFVGSNTRWRTNGDTRECLWCCNHSQKLRRWVEKVDKSAWEPVVIAA